MATIRALAVEGPDQPPAVIDAPGPSPAPGEVLVRVGAASINYYDVFGASGAAGPDTSYESAVVVGQDVAGVVESVGEGVEGLAAGDRVFGMLGHKGVIHDG